MLEALENSALEVIETDVSLIQWIDDKEILINEKYFDVKSFCISGNKIVFKGLYDEKEKELAGRINIFFAELDNHSPSPATGALVIMFQPFFLNFYSPQHFELYKNQSLSFHIYSENILLRGQIVEPPPPEHSGIFCI